MKQVLKQNVPPRAHPQQPGSESDSGRHTAAQVGFGRLQGRVALISGGDSGIGRAIAIAFAQEGADVAFIYMGQHGDAMETAEAIESLGRECLKIAIDTGDEMLCRGAVEQVVSHFGKLDILVNNGAAAHPHGALEDLTEAQLLRTFQSNVFSMFYLTKAALPYLERGARIINTTSIAAYRGSPHLLDDAAAKGAIVAFTRSLALSLTARGILVNGVAPGQIWTPLIPSAFGAPELTYFNAQTPMQRVGQPDEIACCYVFLASPDSTFMSGQILHPNGGEIVSG